MIDIRNTSTNEIQTVASLVGYGPEWAQVPRAAGSRTGYLRYDTALKQSFEDLASIEARLIQGIKAEAENRKMADLTAGGAKKKEYAEKRAEVVAWDEMVRSTVGNALAVQPLVGAALTSVVSAFNLTPNRDLKFEHAIASSKRFGDQPRDAIERFRKGMLKADARASQREALISAEEEYACAMVRAAATAAAKRAAAAVPSWTGYTVSA